MREILRAGLFAVAMIGLLPVGAVHAADSIYSEGQKASIDVARIKAVLRLTADQEPYWPPVEAALRDVARRQQTESENTNFVRRVSNRLVSVVLDSAAIQRLAVAVRPLIARLDMQQMQTANSLAHEMGLGPVVAALR